MRCCGCTVGDSVRNRGTEGSSSIIWTSAVGAGLLSSTSSNFARFWTSKRFFFLIFYSEFQKEVQAVPLRSWFVFNRFFPFLSHSLQPSFCWIHQIVCSWYQLRKKEPADTSKKNMDSWLEVKKTPLKPGMRGVCAGLEGVGSRKISLWPIVLINTQYLKGTVEELSLKIRRLTSEIYIL